MRQGTWVETGNDNSASALGLAAAIGFAWWLVHLAGAEHPATGALPVRPASVMAGAHGQATAHAVNVAPGVGWWAMAAAVVLACAVTLLIVAAAIWPLLRRLPRPRQPRRLRRPSRPVPPTLAAPEKASGDAASVIVLADYTSRDQTRRRKTGGGAA